MKSLKSLALVGLVAVLTAACGSSGLGDVLGGGNSSRSNYEVRGTVESVDPSTRSIYLTNVSGYTSMLSSGNRVRVYYEDRTPVVWQGNTYRPQDLERGDQIVARVSESGNNVIANDIQVTHNVSSGVSHPGTSSSSSIMRGTVRYVDTSRRTIELDSTSWVSRFNQGTSSNTGRVIVQYDANTSVDVSGRLYPVGNLEVGDVVDVHVQPMSGGSYYTQRILLVRDVNARW